MSVPGGGLARAFRGPKIANYQPDYQAIINQDPAFSAFKNSISAQGIADAAQRSQATNQALIQFGDVPNFAAEAGQLGLSAAALKMLQADINPATAGLAAHNQFSTEAEMQRQEEQAMRALRNNLAARGGLSSGEDAYQTGNQEHAYEGAQQKALLQLLGAITGYQQNFTNSQQGEQGQLDQAIQQAEATDAGLPQYQGFALHYNARSGRYVGPSGEQYTPHRQGNTWILQDNGTGLSYVLNKNGTLTLKS